jgi:type I restriction enzyme R subunit
VRPRRAGSKGGSIRQGTTLTGVEVQAEKHAVGMPAGRPAPVRPLSFLCQSTGAETRFTNRLDPAPRSRPPFRFHRPETLAKWIQAEPVWLPMVDGKPSPLILAAALARAGARADESLFVGNEPSTTSPARPPPA